MGWCHNKKRERWRLSFFFFFLVFLVFLQRRSFLMIKKGTRGMRMSLVVVVVVVVVVVLYDDDVDLCQHIICVRPVAWRHTRTEYTTTTTTNIEVAHCCYYTMSPFKRVGERACACACACELGHASRECVCVCASIRKRASLPPFFLISFSRVVGIYRDSSNSSSSRRGLLPSGWTRKRTTFNLPPTSSSHIHYFTRTKKESSSSSSSSSRRSRAIGGRRRGGGEGGKNLFSKVQVEFSIWSTPTALRCALCLSIQTYFFKVQFPVGRGRSEAGNNIMSDEIIIPSFKTLHERTNARMNERLNEWTHPTQ